MEEEKPEKKKDEPLQPQLVKIKTNPIQPQKVKQSGSEEKKTTAQDLLISAIKKIADGSKETETCAKIINNLLSANLKQDVLSELLRKLFKDNFKDSALLVYAEDDEKFMPKIMTNLYNNEQNVMKLAHCVLEHGVHETAVEIARDLLSDENSEV